MRNVLINNMNQYEIQDKLAEESYIEYNKHRDNELFKAFLGLREVALNDDNE